MRSKTQSGIIRRRPGMGGAPCAQNIIGIKYLNTGTVAARYPNYRRQINVQAPNQTMRNKFRTHRRSQ